MDKQLHILRTGVLSGALLTLAALAWLAVGCMASSDAADDTTGADTDGSPGDVADTDAKDTATDDVEADTGADVCQDLRQFGDQKQVNDRCWDPPAHYCADGGSTVVVRACKPDYSVCCTFATTCAACGWLECIATPDPRCDTAPLDTEECALAAIRPDEAATFCYDE